MSNSGIKLTNLRTKNLSLYQQDILILLFFLLLPWILWYQFFNQAIIMGDNWRAAYPAYQLTIEKVLHGSSLLWNEFSLAGHPFLAEIVNGVLYPPKLLLYLILPVPLAYNATILIHLSLTGFFTYLYLCRIGITKQVALLGGVILMLSPIYLIQQLDSISLLHSITWFPLIIYFIEARIISGHKKWLLFAALTFVLQLFAGFTQDSFYTAFAVVVYAAVRYCDQSHYFSIRYWRIFSYDMILFALIVISFSAIQLFPTQELLFFAQHYQQGWVLISEFSAPPLGLLGFFHPFLWGGFSDGYGIQTHYFLHSFINNPYMGMLTILFALNALKYWQNNIIQAWIILLFSTLLIAAGIHVLPIAKLLYAFPLTHAFRLPTRMYFISSMAIVVLFAYAFDQFLRKNEQQMRSETMLLLKLGGVINLAVFVFICGLIVGIDFFHAFADQLRDQMINHQSLQSFFEFYQWSNIALFIPFIAFIFDAILLLLLVFSHGKKQVFLVFSLGLICLFEISLISSSFFVKHPAQFNNEALILKLKSQLKPMERISYASIQEPPPRRISDSVGALYQVPTIDGFVSFDERQIASLQPGIISLAELGNDPDFFIKVLQKKNDFLSMLGMKYAILQKKFATAIDPFPSYKKVLTSGQYVVYENLNAMPRLYSLSDVRFEKNINYDQVDLTKTAVLNLSLDSASDLGTAQIEQIQFQAGNIKTKVSCQTAHCFVILSESYFPGWKAFVDGKRQTLYKVNDLIMGTTVKKGEHIIKFYYLPDSFLLGLLLFIAGLVWVPFWLMKKKS